MSITVGGLGVMALRRPFAEWSDMVLGKGEIRSIFCAVVSFLVFLVLAYLTNPPEASFRTYLTEQSFRQHLSRLDDSTDDDATDPEDVKVHYSLTSRGSTAPCDRQPKSSSPFHFANRASVSLRTPKHVFHSFGIFTIAAVIPIAKCRSTGNDHGSDRDTSMITDSWFVGAFGKWWRGGVIEAWYHDIVSGHKDEEGWSSGILGMKALDKRSDFKGLPFPTTTSPRLLPRGSPPKLRNRERSSQRLGGLPSRSLTPPPLPKSASLPLHATRLAASNSDHKQPNGTHSQSQPVVPSDQLRLLAPMHSRTSSGLFDQSPLIAEVLRQIATSKSTVHDLRAQLTDFQTAASQSHDSLVGEVDSYRERKRQEDASKLELKSRTKALEDSKRSAESSKRDAEKRLKAAQSARDDASHRMEYLDKEINRLQQRLIDDETSAQQGKEEASNTELEICAILEHKKQEIKVTEDVVAALNARARELEDKIAAEKEKLRLVREQADIRKQDRSFFPLHIVNHDSSTWSPISYSPFDTSVVDRPDGMSASDTAHSRDSSEAAESKSPKPPKLSLGSISNFSPKPCEPGSAALRAKGYSIFDDDFASLAQSQHTRFSPFADTDGSRSGGILSPTTSSLIPSSLIQSLDGRSSENVSRSFQSESDAVVEPEWRNLSIPYSQSTESNVQATSPISLNDHSVKESDSPFDVRQPVRVQNQFSLDHLQRVLPNRTHSDPATYGHRYGDADVLHADKVGPRRWLSTLARENHNKKGLNPDAKVFRLNKQSLSNAAPAPTANGSFDALTPYDALNPTGLSPSMSTSATPSTSTSLLRAFAPSPAEREALRAFGGSTERLPSLSDVGSIPSSPSHVQAVAVPPGHRFARETGSVLPSWLQSLPLIKKPNFSPWDDEEPPAGTGA